MPSGTRAALSRDQRSRLLLPSETSYSAALAAASHSARTARCCSHTARTSDITEVPDGLRVRIRRSKTDQEGEGQEVAIPRGYRLRPVEALQAWLAAAEISSGPIFRPVGKGDRVSAASLSAFSAAEIVKHYATRAGLDPASFAGHSLRSGFLTSAAGAWRVGVEDDGRIAPQISQHVARLRAQHRVIQGSRWRGVPVIQRAVHSQAWPGS